MMTSEGGSNLPPTSRRSKKHIPLSFLGEPLAACQLPLPVVLVVDGESTFSHIFRTLQRHIGDKRREAALLSGNNDDDAPRDDGDDISTLPELLRGSFQDFMLNQVQVDDQDDSSSNNVEDSAGRQQQQQAGRRKGRIVEPCIQASWTLGDLQHPSSVILVRPAKRDQHKNNNNNAPSSHHRTADRIRGDVRRLRRIRFVGGPIREDRVVTLDSVDPTLSFLDLRTRLEALLCDESHRDDLVPSLRGGDAADGRLLATFAFAPVDPSGVVGPYYPLEMTLNEVNFDGFLLKLRSVTVNPSSSSRRQSSLTSPSGENFVDKSPWLSRHGTLNSSVTSSVDLIGNESSRIASRDHFPVMGDRDVSPSTRTVRVLVPLVEQLTADEVHHRPSFASSSASSIELPSASPHPLLPSSSLAHEFAGTLHSSREPTLASGLDSGQLPQILPRPSHKGSHLPPLVSSPGPSAAPLIQSPLPAAPPRAVEVPEVHSEEEVKLVRSLSKLLDTANASPNRLPPLAPQSKQEKDDGGQARRGDGADVDDEEVTTRAAEEPLSSDSSAEHIPPSKTHASRAGETDERNLHELPSIDQRRVEIRDTSSALYKRRPDDLRTPASQHSIPMCDDLEKDSRPSAVVVDPMRSVMSDGDLGFAPPPESGGAAREMDEYSSDFSHSSTSSSSSESHVSSRRQKRVSPSNSSRRSSSSRSTSSSSSSTDLEQNIRQALRDNKNEQGHESVKQKPPPSTTIEEMLSKMPIPKLSRRVEAPISKRHGELLQQSDEIARRHKAASAPLTASKVYSTSPVLLTRKKKATSHHSFDELRQQNKSSAIRRLLSDEPPALFTNVIQRSSSGVFDLDEQQHYKNIATTLLGHAYSIQKDKAEAVAIAEFWKNRQGKKKEGSPLGDVQQLLPQKGDNTRRTRSLSPGLARGKEKVNKQVETSKKPKSKPPAVSSKKVNAHKADEDGPFPSAVTGIDEGKVIIRGIPVLTRKDLGNLLLPIADDAGEFEQAEHLKRLHFVLKVREELQTRLMDTPGEHRSLQGTIANVYAVNEWIDTWLEETKWRDARLDLFDAESSSRLNLMRQWRSRAIQLAHPITAMQTAHNVADMAPVLLEEFSVAATNFLRESCDAVMRLQTAESLRSSMQRLEADEAQDRRGIGIRAEGAFAQIEGQVKHLKWMLHEFARGKLQDMASSLEGEMYSRCKLLERLFMLTIAEGNKRRVMEREATVGVSLFGQHLSQLLETYRSHTTKKLKLFQLALRLQKEVVGEETRLRRGIDMMHGCEMKLLRKFHLWLQEVEARLFPLQSKRHEYAFREAVAAARLSQAAPVADDFVLASSSPDSVVALRGNELAAQMALSELDSMPAGLRNCGALVCNSDPSITRINLSKLKDGELSERVLENLVAILSVRPAPLHALDLSGNASSVPVNFATVVKLVNLVQQLDLSNCGLDERHELELVKALSLSTVTLRTLHLDNNNLPSSVFVSIGTLIRQDRTPLTKVTVAGNPEATMHLQRSLQFLCDCNRHEVDVKRKILALESDESGVESINFSTSGDNHHQHPYPSHTTLADDDADHHHHHDAKISVLDDVSARCITAALGSNSSCREILLRGHKLTDRAATLFAHILRGNPTLQTVDLSRNHISDKGARELCSAVMTNSTITKFDLDGDRITDRSILRQIQLRCEHNKIHAVEQAQRAALEAAQLVRLADVHEKCRQLLEYWKNLDGAAAAAFWATFEAAEASVLAMRKVLANHPLALRQRYFAILNNEAGTTMLDLGSYDGIQHCSDESFALLKSAMESGHNIYMKNLVMSNLEGRITPTIVLPLIASLSTRLDSLDMSKCGLTDHDLNPLLRITMRDPACTLRHLKLHGNKLSAAFAKDLAAFCKSSPLLHSVTLFDNLDDVTAVQCDVINYYCDLNKEGAEFKDLVRRVESDAPDLKILSLSKNGHEVEQQHNTKPLDMTDNHVRLLAVALCANKHVTSIDISHQHVTDIGAFALAKMLKANAVIGSLDLSFNMLSDAGCQALEAVVQGQSYRRPLRFILPKNLDDFNVSQSGDGFLIGLCGNEFLSAAHYLDILGETNARHQIDQQESLVRKLVQLLLVQLVLPSCRSFSSFIEMTQVLFAGSVVAVVNDASCRLQKEEECERRVIEDSCTAGKRLLSNFRRECLDTWVMSSSVEEASFVSKAILLYAEAIESAKERWCPGPQQRDALRLLVEGPEADARDFLAIAQQEVFALLIRVQLQLRILTGITDDALDTCQKLLQESAIALDLESALRAATLREAFSNELALQIQDESFGRLDVAESEEDVREWLVMYAEPRIRRLVTFLSSAKSEKEALFTLTCEAAEDKAAQAIRRRMWEPSPSQRKELQASVDDVEEDLRLAIRRQEEAMFRTGVDRWLKFVTGTNRFEQKCVAAFQQELDRSRNAFIILAAAPQSTSFAFSDEMRESSAGGDFFSGGMASSSLAMLLASSESAMVSPRGSGAVSPSMTSMALAAAADVSPATTPRGNSISSSTSMDDRHHARRVHLAEQAMKHLPTQPWDLQTKGEGLMANDASITSIDISYAGTNPEEPRCTPDTIAVIYALTKYNRGLRTLNLNGNKGAITIRSVPLLIKLIAQTRLTTLQISDCGLSDDAIVAPFAHFLSLPQCCLTTLTMDKNAISPHGASMIARGLRGNTTITTFHMAENAIELEKLTHDFLSFYVGSNRYGERFKSTICRVEANDATLPIVSFAGPPRRASVSPSVSPPVTPRGEVLKQEQRDEVLRNGLLLLLDDQAVKLLCIALSQSKVVSQVLLPNNAITDKGAKFLSFLMKSVPTLQIIDLSGNDISDHGVRELVEAAAEAASAQNHYVEIKMDGNPQITAPVRRLLAAQQEKTAQLRHPRGVE